MATTEEARPQAARTLAERTSDPAMEFTEAGTLRIGGLEATLPDPEKPMSVMHYINQHRKSLWATAQTFYMGGLVPNAILKMPDPREGVAAVFTILSTGLELGLGFATSLRTIYVVEGRATLSSDLMRALATQAGCQFVYKQRDEEACIIDVYRGGDLIGTAKFTWAMALKAGLTGKNNWKNYPDQMLAARCGSIAARMGAPDRLAGFYTVDEIEEDPEAGPAPRRENPLQDAADAVVGAQMRADQAERTRQVNEDLGVKTVIAPISDAQRAKLMALATKLGRKVNVERAGHQGKHTKIKTDDRINKELGLPEGEDVWLADLDSIRASTLIDIFAKREAEMDAKEGRDRDIEDAGHALGERP